MMSFLYRTRVNNLKYRYGMASPINIEDYYTCGWYTVVGVNEMDEWVLRPIVGIDINEIELIENVMIVYG